MNETEGKWKRIVWKGKNGDEFCAELKSSGVLSLKRAGGRSGLSDTVSFMPDDLPEILSALAKCAWEAGVA